MLLVPPGILFSAPQDDFLVLDEFYIRGCVGARVCVCAHMCAPECGVREEPPCAVGRCTCVPSVEPYCKPRIPGVV